MAQVNSSLSDSFDPLQFTLSQQVDGISLTLHSSLEHLDNKDISVKDILSILLKVSS